MSLYREVRGRGRSIAAAAVAGLVVGSGLGFAGGRATSSSPSLAARLEQLRGELREATDALELVSIEYRQAVRDGRVVASSELAATEAHLERAGSVLAAARPELDALSISRTRIAGSELGRVEALVDSRASAAAVDAQVRRAGAAIVAAAGGR